MESAAQMSDPSQEQEFEFRLRMERETAAQKPDIATQIANDPISQGARANLNPYAAMQRNLMLAFDGADLNHLIDQGAYWAGGKTTDLTGSPAAGTAVNAALQAGPMIAGGEAAKVTAPVGRWMAERLMKSAIKPTLPDQASGKAARAISTMLDRGYNPTMGGVQAMSEKVSGNDAAVKALVSNSSGSVDKYAVADRLRPVLNDFGKSPLPNASTNTINNSWTEFLNHPELAGKQSMPVQLAQEMKQRGYKDLGDAAYGIGLKPAAERDSLKAITQGLKEEIEGAIPAVAPINAESRELLNARKIALRRALLEGNKNPVPLPSAIAAAVHNPAAALGLWANSSAYAKAMAARLINSGKSQGPAILTRFGVGAGTMDQGE